jgi:RNA polymerase sigma-70 factor (ECF subfamily)
MDQAESTIKAAFDPLIPGTTVADGASNGTYPRSHLAPTPLLDRMVGTIVGPSRTQVRRPNVPQGDNLFSLNEGTATTSPLSGGATPETAPTDYACATNEQLLESARASDKEAFAELCSRHVKSVQRKVFGIVRNHEDTEDVVQETLLKAYTHLSGFRGSCTFSTWLTSIAINSALMLLRKRKGHLEVSFDHSVDDDQTWSSREFADPHLDTERSYARRQALRVLSGAVVRLPLRYRSVLERYHAREQSMKETADTLGLTVAAVKSRLLRGRLNLRATLARRGISIADAYF